ncbi:hypothetical protein EON83_24530 [bacterium]|nr:MAG: hypothetical protein EON83_24530 [bacterium]
MKKTLVLAVLPCALGVRTACASALLKPTSGVTQALTPKSLQIESNLRGAFAQTTVTTTYANPNSRRIEADFIYSAPKSSVVTGFSYWYGKEKVVARVVEKGRAAQIYQYITTRMRDPALIEMVGPNKFRARIFPVEANTDLKIEVRLAQTLGATKDGQLWSWPMLEETSNGLLENVSVHLKSDRAFRSNLGNVKNNELTFTKTNFQATGNANVIVPQNPAPLRASLVAARDGGPDGFFALALTSNSPVALPRLNISGVSTYDVLIPTMRRLDANGNFVVIGRYRGNGTALVSLNGRSVQVKFPDTQEKNNIPSLLWASGRIEALSSKDANKTQVMTLSKRFGIPSRWTSWLAIPEEERSRYKLEMLKADRDNAAKAYAQAVAQGNDAQKWIHKLKFDDLTKQLVAEGGGGEPLSYYLDEELQLLQRAKLEAKYNGKISRQQTAKWAVWSKNLLKAGAEKPEPSDFIEDEMEIVSRLYVEELEAGQKNGPQGRRYRARLGQLVRAANAQEMGLEDSTYLEQEAQERAQKLADELANLRVSARPNRNREQQLQRRLARLGELTDTSEVLHTVMEEVGGAKIREVGNKWANEISAGRGGGKLAAQYAREMSQMQNRWGLNYSETVVESWNWVAQKTGKSFANAIRMQGADGAAAKALDTQIAKIAAQGKHREEYLRARAWQEVMLSGVAQLGSKIRTKGSGSQEALIMRQQLDALSGTHNLAADYSVRNAWRELANQIGNDLAAEVRSKRENTDKARTLQLQLETAKKHVGDNEYISNAEYAWDERAREAAKKAFALRLKNGGDTTDSRQLIEQAKEYGSKGTFAGIRALDIAASEAVADIRENISTQIVNKEDESAKTRELRGQLGQVLGEFSGVSSTTNLTSEDYAWEARAHESAYRLLEAQKNDPTNSAQINEFQRDLDRSVEFGRKNPSDVLAYEKARLDANEPLVSASDYRLRSGDPLISVMAPATCRAVVAQMPDGTLLPLRFNALNKSWEARFDVPTFALDGDYRVKILIVAPDGGRRQLTMNFAVDSSAPQGKGAVSRDSNMWHLSLQSDEHTDRVSAFLPWNERAELRRNENGLFVVDVAVPAEFAEAKAQVRFLLTDGAHNKTEVLVDLNH